MINQNSAETQLLESVKDKVLSTNKWAGARFEKFKTMSSTEKGDAGEDLLEYLLQLMGYEDVEVPKGRRAHYDVRVNATKFEVKVATEDTKGGFQFNGVRHDRKYTHLFFLGIMPDSISFMIVDKANLDDHTLVAMQKGTNATFKITKSKADLLAFDSFEAEIKKVVDDG